MAIWIIITVVLAFVAVGEYCYYNNKITKLENEIKELKYKNNIK